MLRLRPTYEEMLKEARASRLKKYQKGRKEHSKVYYLTVNFAVFDLDKFNIRNANKATQTDMFNEPSRYSSASSNRSVKTAIEGNEDSKQDRQVSLSSGEFR